MKELLLNEQFLTAVIGVIIAFFFGQTGILKTWFDKIFISKEKRELAILEEKKRTHDLAIQAEEKETARFNALEKEKEELRAQIKTLQESIAKIDKDLVKTTIYVNTLLAFLENAIPEGHNAFIVQMASEIRKENNK